MRWQRERDPGPGFGVELLGEQVRGLGYPIGEHFGGEFDALPAPVVVAGDPGAGRIGAQQRIEHMIGTHAGQGSPRV